MYIYEIFGQVFIEIEGDIINILLLSHGYLAKELYETANLIVGETSMLNYISLPAGANLVEYEQKVYREINSKKNNLLILLDLFGGTPFMTVSKVLGKMENWNNIEVITGVNLPMLLEVLNLASNNEKLENLKNVAIQMGNTGIVDVKNELKKRIEEDDE